MNRAVVYTVRDIDNNDTISMSYITDGTIVQHLQKFRDLLASLGFTDKTINKYLDVDKMNKEEYNYVISQVDFNNYGVVVIKPKTNK